VSYVELGCRSLLVAVFATAIAGKVTRSAFGEYVSSTGRLLPTRLAGWGRSAAAAVLVAELTTVALLLTPNAAVAGFAAAAGLSAAFAAGVAGALRRGERAPCRCFGASTAPLGRTHLARNALVGVTALVGLASTQATTAEPWHLGGAATAVLAGLVVAALVVRLDDLTALFTPSSPRRQA
jgi:hypothetical protein